ncbi:thioredoxin domain-containing protein [Bacteroidota bacterium]
MKISIHLYFYAAMVLFSNSCAQNSDNKIHDKDMTKHANLLINEKSPYLLQHAHNPVNWYPWSEEAFNIAREQNKPIFLSIGYSTCHWCHVMERESFEDQQVAELMNDVFISIKVDREERPDIDNIYMKVCQMITGRGGWPLTILMTPDKKPFYAGTYFPKESKHGRIGMIELIKQVNDVWQNKREDIDKSIEQILENLNRLSAKQSQHKLDSTIFNKAFEEFARQFDDEHGGFGNAPKFSVPHNLMFLLRHNQAEESDKSLSIVEQTLSEMKNGGIYDHIGFGFHRYSTDRNWLVPHFEKMLYDQALLSMAYTEAFLLTKNEDYKETALEIFEYVLRDMSSREGGFYSAEDADSEGVEGKFYTWSSGEINALLDSDESKIFNEVFNIKESGNFDDEATRAKNGMNIPHITENLSEIAANLDLTPIELKVRLNSIKRSIYIHREKRVHPLKDDKILSDWNGLMIAALAKGGKSFEEARLIEAAESGVKFILTKMRNNSGQLLHRYKDGEAGISANADDYAFFIWGLLELYDATLNSEYLAHSLELNDIFIEHYWDETRGGFYFTPDFGEKLLIRSKEIYDGAIPSANSVALMNLVRLSRITAETKYEKYIEEIIDAFSDDILRMPSVYSQFLSAFSLASGQSKEIVIVGRRDSKDTGEMLRALNSNFHPDKVIIFVPVDEPDDPIHKIADYTSFYNPVDGKATAFVCRNRECSLPTTNISEMLDQLR